MDTNQILTLTVFVVVITIVGTIALAAVGYFAFRLRERRDPSKPGVAEGMVRPYFFERLTIAETDLALADGGSAAALPAGETDAATTGAEAPRG